MIKLSNNVITTLNFGSFPGFITFACGYSAKEITAILKRQKCHEIVEQFQTTIDSLNSDVWGYAARRESVNKGKSIQYFFLVVKDRFDFTDANHHAILAHEVLHICTYNLSQFLDIVQENEAFAYTHTHIMKQIYAALKPHSNKK